MRRSSTTLYLESLNATTPVPWNNGNPIFNSFSEPTRSALEGAWNGFVASGLEVIPDPEPVTPEVNPNWQGFLNRLDLPYPGNEGGTGLFQYYLLQIDRASAWQAYNMVREFIKGQGGIEEIRTLSFLYSGFAAVLPQEQRGILQQAIDDFNIPVELSPE